ncbi:ABC transporter ATP-binding protein [Paenibacillus sp. IB182496]|uniref:ABC transporter ATP-binding protein n=1 Tax=Paenibacillus sabuli TaxID=2772509 RepID=A0A927BW69_9BACL|nr:ABC transporter ATP-binding protein [Paenibacillus sabuli]MBD2847026.1 ABC transporter ATP-binding protein [Paenibacillus sabuli]
MRTIVEVREVSKRYKDNMAVDRVSFTLEEGKIYGMLGRNGAGKTTIMQLLTAQAIPSDGEIRLFGEAPYENARVLGQVCFIKESQKYPDNFKVADALAVAAMFFPNWDASYAEALRQQYNLPERRQIKKLSRGMLSAVGIIIGLASRAPLTIFDEPYLGLDAVARRMFYDQLMADYIEHPRTVVLSTHLIDEVSRLLEHVLVIDRGRILINEEAESLRQQAFAVAGPMNKVETFAQGMKVIQRDPLGALLTATVLGSLGPEQRHRAEELGLEFAPVSLQELIVQLTKNQSEGKAAERV